MFQLFTSGKEDVRLGEIREAKENLGLIKNLIQKEFASNQRLTSLLLKSTSHSRKSQDSLVLNLSYEDLGLVSVVDSFYTDNSPTPFIDSDSNIFIAFTDENYPQKAAIFDTKSLLQTLQKIAKPLKASAYLLSNTGVFLSNTDSTDLRKILPHTEHLDMSEIGNKIYTDLIENNDLLRFITLIDINDSQFVVLILTVPNEMFYDDFGYLRKVILFLAAFSIVLILSFIAFASLKYSEKVEEKVEVQNKLQVSNAQLLSFIENPGTVSIFSLDLELKYTGFNSLHEKEMLEIFDAKIEKGMEILPLIPESISNAMQTYFTKALNGDHFTITTIFRDKYYSLVYNPVYSRTENKSEIIGLTANIFEVTEKIKAEQELEKYRDQLEELVEARTNDLVSQKNFFQNIIDQVPSLVFVRNNKGEYIMANRAVINSFGYKTADLTGKEILKTHLDKKKADQYYKEDLEILKTGRIIEEENLQIDHDGSDIWYFLTKKRIELGGEYFLLGVQYNITFLKQAEERLQKTNKKLKKTLKDLEATQARLVESEKMASIGQLMAGLAHEINNPMNYVSGNIEPIKADLEEIKKYLEASHLDLPQYIKDTFKEISQLVAAVEEGAQRVNTLMSELNNFSSKSHTEKTKVNILEPIQSTLNLISHLVKDKITIELELEDNAPEVSVNLQAIKQVFLNVLNNAIYSISDSGKIVIKIEVEKKFLVVRFIDNGEGIPKDNLPNVMNPFFTTKDVGEGTGLGLSISYNIMEEHQGRIIIDSVEKKGTTVTLKFPL